MDTEKRQTGNEILPRNDDYLWDGSGEPDPEVQRLEALLGRFHHDRPAPLANPSGRAPDTSSMQERRGLESRSR